jgi:L-ribulokinase
MWIVLNGSDKMSEKKYVLGVDFGTDSVRSVIVDTADGDVKASYVVNFKRWVEGMFCDPSENRFRQHPLDYIEGLEESVTGALKTLPAGTGEMIRGIGVDTTGSTPAPVDKNGTVLALKEEFAANPNAMFVLWKDHTAVNEADRINETARNWGGKDFTKYSGGVYSSEWFWAKILHVLRTDPDVRSSAFSWIEHSDWIPSLLTGNLDPLTLKRGRCPAGHKAMWHEEWDGLPPEDFLVKIDPMLAGLRSRLYSNTVTADSLAGGLTEEWAKRLGLKQGTAVAVGSFDAHMGAVGSEIKENRFVMILGTSACDMAVAPREVVGDKLIDGICGQVDGSIIPGMIGLEAGQSGFGDVYAWFRKILTWPFENMLEESGIADSALTKKIKDKMEADLIDRLSEEASRLDVTESVPVALDWLNGRRTPYADQKLKGAVIGLTLGTTAVTLFKALVESTAFGAKAIIDRFEDEGIDIEEVVASGGIPKKSPFVMQVMSNVLGVPVMVALSDQAGALGAAMFAAVASGIFKSIRDAQKAMGNGFLTTYKPDKSKTKIYSHLYRRYLETGGSLEENLRK